ncbi:MAG TPA: hypothetical protein VES67_05695 [Vicinamibacterales bacterium]|nr:hypothetical protein [Vicinamibacterales bacterium]
MPRRRPGGVPGLRQSSAPRRRFGPSGLLRRIFTLRRILVAVVLVFVIVIGGPLLFIATQCYGNGAQSASELPEPVRTLSNYTRAEAYTYLTLPEWLIVYSGDEYGQFIAHTGPSRFPYLRSVFQYWSGYRAVCQITKREYPFETGYHVMLGVIGASFTIEHVVKGLYEHTVGRVTEWLFTRDTPEDAYAVRTAQEYGTFMHTVPWYEFPFGARLAGLWKQTPAFGPHFVRKWERRFVLTAEYGSKAIYGWVIGTASGAAYGAEDLQIHAWIENVPPAVFADTRVQSVARVGETGHVVRMPRYEAFTTIALALHAQGVRFVNIAGNDEILVTAIGPAGRATDVSPARLASRMPLPTDRSRERLALRVPVASLHEVITRLLAAGVAIEHLYDY